MLLALYSFQLGAQQARFDEVDRIVVVGDVHGAYAAFAELLQATAVTDAEGHWIAGATHLISLGDLLDRGPASRAAMDAVMRLQQEAQTAGGRVHVVLGNHELMNLTGDLRYVSTAEYAAFAADESAAERDQAFELLAATAAATPTRAEFEASYPPGYFAHRRAFAADGLYGAWLLDLPTVVVVNDWAYLHGGLGPTVVGRTLDEINAATRELLQNYLKLRAELAAGGALPPFDMQQDPARVRSQLAERSRLDSATTAALDEFQSLIEAADIGLDSPLWYRGSAYCKPILELPILNAALAALEADRVVVGHTPTQPRRVQTRLDRRVVMLDTGMLTSYYSGRPAALVIEPEATYVRYLEPDATVAWADIDEAVALGLSAERIDALLKHGSVREFERLDGDETGELVLTLEGTSIPAWFYANRSGELELAADKLDQRLGTDLVPPTVAREIDGTAGAVQLRYPDEVTESARIEAGLSIAGWCPMEPQLALMNSFDVLIYNRSRNRDNIAFNNDFSDLTLTAHGQVFGSERNLFPGFDPATLEIPAGLIATMRALDEQTLTADLGDWLDRRQIRALLSRRDQLLKDH